MNLVTFDWLKQKGLKRKAWRERLGNFSNKGVIFNSSTLFARLEDQFRSHIDTHSTTDNGCARCCSSALLMDSIHAFKKEAHNPWLDQRRSPRDLWVQIAISSALGASAFLAFCVSSVFLFFIPEYGLTACRFSVLDGANSMLHGRGRKMLRRNSQNCQSLYLAGCRFSIGSQMRRC